MSMKRRSAIVFVRLLVYVNAFHVAKSDDQCSLSESLTKEIQGYKTVVDQIADAAIRGQAKGRVWNELADFVDKFGNRISGSKNLENAIDYMINRSVAFGLDNVHGEPVTVPHWVRGNEGATLISPRKAKLNILGLGGSVSTPKSGITADVLVVESFDELKKRSTEAKGKIVVFAQKWESYQKTLKYRLYAASKSAAAGGVASLVRSIAPFSIDSPHTGLLIYQDGIKKIPAAAITIEDAEMLLRMAKRGDKIKIKLYMEAKTLDPVVSRNTVVEVTGSQNPQDFVLVSGHIDSWDVGTGAMDDGGGAFISWYTVVLLKKLGLQPKRTLRAVLWTGEEEGLIGAVAYKNAHDEKNMVLLMESDQGTFNPQGIIFNGVPQAQLMAPLNATELELSNNVRSDISVWSETSVPLAALKTANDKYYWFHHSNGDRMTVEDTDVLDRCLAVWASVSYIVADLSETLPKRIT